MIPINIYKLYLYLVSHQKEYEKLSDYLNFLNKAEPRVLVKDHEWHSLAQMITVLISHRIFINNLDGYYLGYKINQISREFDLLRISTSSVINIELKSESTDKIKKQLVMNRHYLSHLSLEMIFFVYVQTEDQFYKLQDNDLVVISPKEVVTTIQNQKELSQEKIEDLFKISNFLVSPLNNTTRFIKGEYFLTQQQEEIKTSIQNDVSISNNNYIINAGAGTGKTLLIYDIAVLLSNEYKVCIIHCGYLCDGHNILKKRFKNISFLPVKELLSVNFGFFDFIVIDEAYRLYRVQIEKIIEVANAGVTRFIFSLDNRQIISRSEQNADVYNEIMSKLTIIEYKLSDKIRTNKQLAAFIRNMLELLKTNPTIRYDDVDILYCNDYNEARNLIDYYTYTGYTFINYTPSNYNVTIYDKFSGFQSTHQVIGQEFDKVMVMIGNEFIYNDEKQLVARSKAPNPDHILHRMLYQQITRVREKLCILVVGNTEVFNSLLSIVTKNA